MKACLIATLLALASLSLGSCSSAGCPGGTHAEGNRCLPDDLIPDGDSVHSPDGDIEQAEIIAPTPHTKPLDYNGLPSNGSVPELIPIEGFNPPTAEAGKWGMILWITNPLDTMLLPLEITSPAGDRIYDLNSDIQNWAINDESNFHYYADTALSLFIPNTPRFDYLTGEWDIQLTSLDPYPEDAESLPVVETFFSEPWSDPDAEGEFSINIWFVGAGGLTAESAAENAAFQVMMSALKDSYKTINIRINEIRLNDPPTDLVSPYTVIYGFTEYGDMIETISALAENNDPNVFLIDSFGGNELEGVLGLAAHIPGPPGLQGRRHSGIALAMDGFDEYPRIYGMAIAHELGHWLGLFHVTEYNGQYFDALDDTLQCHNDANGDGYVDWNECRDQGSPNIMFWLTPMDDGFELEAGKECFSPHQRWVLQRNPMIRPVAP